MREKVHWILLRKLLNTFSPYSNDLIGLLASNIKILYTINNTWIVKAVICDYLLVSYGSTVVQ